MNLESGQAFLTHPDRPFPMQSVFKLPLAAAPFRGRIEGSIHDELQKILQA